MENNKNILIGMPSSSGLIPAIMVQSLLSLHKPYQCGFILPERQMIEKARNDIVRQAIESGATHLLFLDDDNPIPPDTLEKLLEDDKDIVIAPILARIPNPQGKYALCAFNVEKEHEGVKLYRNIEQLDKDKYLHKIEAGGTGCMLIKIEVLKKLNEIYEDRIFERTRIVFDKPFIFNDKEYKERTMSEDVEFCERAIKAGFEIWLDSRIRPLHIVGNNYIQYGV